MDKTPLLPVTDLVKENIQTLLDTRHRTQADVSEYCGHERSWMNKILKGIRAIGLDDLDHLAAYFDLRPYQLLQPGLTELSERRSGADRRVNKKDRRRQRPVMSGVKHAETPAASPPPPIAAAAKGAGKGAPQRRVAHKGGRHQHADDYRPGSRANIDWKAVGVQVDANLADPTTAHVGPPPDAPDAGGVPMARGHAAADGAGLGKFRGR